MPTHLETWEVCEPQLDLILVEEVLGHGALHRLPVVQLQGEALHLCWPPGDVTHLHTAGYLHTSTGFLLNTHSVLPPHGTAVCDLDLETANLLGELDPLRVGERLALVVDVSDVEDLAHEVDGGLGFVEGGGRHVHVEHHLPLAGPHRLVEPEPDLAAAAQRVIVTCRIVLTLQ